MANTITTPWGAASVVDRLTVQQRAGGRRFATVVELLEHGGERFVRFAYTNDGVARRGPVTLRAKDVAKLRGELAKHPEIAEALGLGA